MLGRAGPPPANTVLVRVASQAFDIKRGFASDSEAEPSFTAYGSDVAEGLALKPDAQRCQANRFSGNARLSMN